MFFGKSKDSERLARWSGCTHIVCPGCGNACQKGYTICSECREKKAVERYSKMERKEWDGKTPLYSGYTDKYFFGEEALSDFIEDSTSDIESLRLIVCEPNYLSPIREDHFCDDLAEDQELPNDIAMAIFDLNKIIEEQKPISWSPGKYAAQVSDSQWG